MKNLAKYRIVRKRKFPPRNTMPFYRLEKNHWLFGWSVVYQFNAMNDEQARHYAFKWLYRDEDDFIVWEFTE